MVEPAGTRYVAGISRYAAVKAISVRALRLRPEKRHVPHAGTHRVPQRAGGLELGELDRHAEPPASSRARSGATPRGSARRGAGRDEQEVAVVEPDPKRATGRQLRIALPE